MSQGPNSHKPTVFCAKSLKMKRKRPFCKPASEGGCDRTCISFHVTNHYKITLLLRLTDPTTSLTDFLLQRSLTMVLTRYYRSFRPSTRLAPGQTKINFYSYMYTFYIQRSLRHFEKKWCHHGGEAIFLSALQPVASMILTECRLMSMKVIITTEHSFSLPLERFRL